MKLFTELGLCQPLLQALEASGYVNATDIQAQAIPLLLAGKDLMGCAQTGTGKTAAFALPTLQRLASEMLTESGRLKPSCEADLAAKHAQAAFDDQPPRFRKPGRFGRKPFNRNHRRDNHRAPRHHGPKPVIRCLVLAPTRELSVQIEQSFLKYSQNLPLRVGVVHGGVSQVPQVRMLERGVDILIATPGRLIDLKNQGYIHLDNVNTLILDEADQMLDMGFLPDLNRIVDSVPQQRQTLMFSATMPAEIRSLASKWLTEPESLQIAPENQTANRVEQSVFHVLPEKKIPLLTEFLKADDHVRTIVFVKTRGSADKIVDALESADIRAVSIHANKSQAARSRSLAQFKSKRPPVLVATDIAARGLDVSNVSHVINFDLPMTPEIYVHRIGRTGRADASGLAVSFCCPRDRRQLRMIERIIDRELTVNTSQPELTLDMTRAMEPSRAPRRDRSDRGGMNGRPGRGPRPAHGSRPAGARNGQRPMSKGKRTEVAGKRESGDKRSEATGKSGYTSKYSRFNKPKPKPRFEDYSHLRSTKHTKPEEGDSTGSTAGKKGSKPKKSRKPRAPQLAELERQARQMVYNS